MYEIKVLTVKLHKLLGKSQGSNLRPAMPQIAALPAELQLPIMLEWFEHPIVNIKNSGLTY